MSYRDDLDAAHARNTDLERQVVALERRQAAVATRRRRSNVGAVIVTLAGLGLALGAVLGGLGWFLTAGAVVVALIGASGVDSSSKHDAGPFPVRHTVEAPCADADVRLLVICLLSRCAPGGARIERRSGPPPFMTDAHDRIVAAAREVIEGVVRTAITARTAAALRAADELGAIVKERVGAALDRYDLTVDSLFVSLLR